MKSNDSASGVSDYALSLTVGCKGGLSDKHNLLFVKHAVNENGCCVKTVKRFKIVSKVQRAGLSREGDNMKNSNFTIKVQHGFMFA